MTVLESIGPPNIGLAILAKFSAFGVHLFVYMWYM